MSVPMNLSHEAIALAIQEALPQARAAWLFGSAANGTMRDDSDMDIAVFTPTPLQGLERFNGAAQLSQSLGRDVDLIDFVRTTTVFQNEILTTGIRLFAHDAIQVDNYEAFTRSEYMRWQEQHRDQLAEIFERGYVLASTIAHKDTSL